MRLIDCVTYFNERDVLQLRLQHLWEIVDQFVIVQATTTHAGLPNANLITNDADFLAPYRSKISIVTVDDLPVAENRWLAEISQRNSILTAAKELGLQAEDVLLIADVDEIPNRKALENLSFGLDRILALAQSLHYYRFDLVARRSWNSARVIHFDLLRILTPNEVRHAFTTDVVRDGGWHFSYLASKQTSQIQFVEKVKNFAHSELKFDARVELPRRHGPLRLTHLGQDLRPFPRALLPPECLEAKRSQFFEWERGPSKFTSMSCRVASNAYLIQRRLFR